jgi:hypothetical protein
MKAPTDRRAYDAETGAVIALIGIREQITDHTDWDRDEILAYLADLIRTAPLPTDDLARINDICQDEIRNL